MSLKNPHPDTLVIDMSPGRGTVCWYCSQETEVGWGLPVWNGELVSTHWHDDWAGVPACQSCHDKHAAGLLPVADSIIETIWGRVSVIE